MRTAKLGIGLAVVAVLVVVVFLGKTPPPTRAERADSDNSTASTGARMIDAAQQVLDGLSEANRAKAVFAFDDPVRTNWHYYPILPEPRKGAVIKAMTPAERNLVKKLLATGVSKSGYEVSLNVIALENILRDIENTEWAKKYRDSELYHICIFGKPAMTGRWGWRFEGHHLSLSYVIDEGKVVATTPIAFGANPGEVPSGPFKGLRALAKEEDLGRQLLTSLDSAARKKAIVSETAPFDVLTEVKVQPKRLVPEGLSQAEMGPRQKQMLEELLQAHAGRQAKEIADQLLKEVADAGIDRVYFAWAGPPQPGQPHYYRLQGPTFVVEFCNAQNRANHIHTVWRSYKGDFGIPLAAQ